MTAPNGSAQRRLINAVQKSLCDQDEKHGKALEAHGTGTALGDPIEVGAAIGALNTSVPTVVLCTSLKANVGHLEAVAGGAGVVALFSMSLSAGHIAPNA